MDSIIIYLEKVLNDEIRHLGKTLQILKEKEKALIKNDLKKLEELVASERELFISLREIEDSRKSVVELFASSRGLKEKVVNLSRVAEIAGGKEGDDLEALRTTVSGLIEAVNRQNEKCSALLRKSIELADYSIRLLTGAATAKKTYTKKGVLDSEAAGKKIILDCKA